MRPLVFSLVPRSQEQWGGGEVEVGTGGCFDRLVAMELGAIVDGDGADAPSGVVDEGDGGSVGGLDGFGRRAWRS